MVLQLSKAALSQTRYAQPLDDDIEPVPNSSQGGTREFSIAHYMLVLSARYIQAAGLRASPFEYMAHSPRTVATRGHMQAQAEESCAGNLDRVRGTPKAQPRMFNSHDNSFFADKSSSK